MRLFALILTALVMCSPVKAQSWQDFTYPDFGFALAFPGEPKVEDSNYTSIDGVSVPARVYSLVQDNIEYKMTVADFSHQTMKEDDVISQAIKTLGQAGEIKVDIPHRISRVFGRQLSIANTDGGHSSIAVFYYQKRLYQITGTVLPSHPDPSSGEAIRFQQSLQFTNNASRFFRFGRIFGLESTSPPRVFSSN
jgi:hypothetical protein